MSSDASQTTELKVGMMIKDNDPRMYHRIYQISMLTETHVIANRSMGDEVKIARKRVFIDSKPRRSGWSVCHV